MPLRGRQVRANKISPRKLYSEIKIKPINKKGDEIIKPDTRILKKRTKQKMRRYR